MGNYGDLQVWQRAQRFAVRVDLESRRLGRGNGELADQLRRAALSVPTNLAEGAVKGRDPEFVRFLGIAIGSAAEAESLLEHAREIRMLDRCVAEELEAELTVIRKMLFSFAGRCSQRLAVPRTPWPSSATSVERPHYTSLSHPALVGGVCCKSGAVTQDPAQVVRKS